MKIRNTIELLTYASTELPVASKFSHNASAKLPVESKAATVKMWINLAQVHRKFCELEYHQQNHCTTLPLVITA